MSETLRSSLWFLVYNPFVYWALSMTICVVQKHDELKWLCQKSSEQINVSLQLSCCLTKVWPSLPEKSNILHCNYTFHIEHQK